MACAEQASIAATSHASGCMAGLWRRPARNGRLHVLRTPGEASRLSDVTFLAPPPMRAARSTSDRRAALQAVGLGRLEPPVTPVDLSDLGVGALVALLQPLARPEPGGPTRGCGPGGESGGDSGGGSGGGFGGGYVAIVREASELGLLAEELEASLAERGIPVRALLAVVFALPARSCSPYACAASLPLPLLLPLMV